MPHRYTQAQLDFVQREYKEKRLPQLTEAFNARFGLALSRTAIKSTLKNHGFKCGRPRGLAPGERSTLDAEQVQWLARNYRRMTLQQLTPAFNARFGYNYKPKALHAHLKRRGIDSGRTGRFERGTQPWNAGTRGLMKANATSFKKGDKPVTMKPIGSERICAKDGYILVKIASPDPYTPAKTRYRHKHLVIWEQHHGPVPAGHVVTFIDGDKLNCAIENLECISRTEHCRRNKLQLASAPHELKPPIKAMAKLITKTHERARSNG